MSLTLLEELNYPQILTDGIIFKRSGTGYGIIR